MSPRSYEVSHMHFFRFVVHRRGNDNAVRPRREEHIYGSDGSTAPRRAKRIALVLSTRPAAFWNAQTAGKRHRLRVGPSSNISKLD